MNRKCNDHSKLCNYANEILDHTDASSTISCSSLPMISKHKGLGVERNYLLYFRCRLYNRAGRGMTYKRMSSGLKIIEQIYLFSSDCRAVTF